MAKLKEFIVTKKPHVIGVTAETRDALMIIDDIKHLVEQLSEAQEMAPINVELVDNELAMVYENCAKAKVSLFLSPDTMIGIGCVDKNFNLVHKFQTI